ncbi:hypothetical protein SKAU_G00033010 [Synaphobranchus kaupii]|uniref:Uncharacterized protein n=1 Tax=Synaphobranchus kaupii TaxID=118154 RepID=A0A9Q1GF60_SYNKA|nr:hypothetical protein SKAU_G00033010 [Synaphobranchus kaupii]
MPAGVINIQADTRQSSVRCDTAEDTLKKHGGRGFGAQYRRRTPHSASPARSNPPPRTSASSQSFSGDSPVPLRPGHHPFAARPARHVTSLTPQAEDEPPKTPTKQDATCAGFRLLYLELLIQG